MTPCVRYVRGEGPEVQDFSVGDEAFAVTTKGIEGCHAEMIALPAELCARKPAGVGHHEVAAMDVTGLTALAALEDAGQIRKGETVLINGGSGGVGSMAVQYARSARAQVWATAHTRNIDYVVVADYTQANFRAMLHGCDVLLDTAGGKSGANR